MMWRGWSVVTVVALVGPLAAASSAGADHTPAASSVTVAGSLQSELVRRRLGPRVRGDRVDA